MKKVAKIIPPQAPEELPADKRKKKDLLLEGLDGVVQRLWGANKENPKLLSTVNKEDSINGSRIADRMVMAMRCQEDAKLNGPDVVAKSDLQSIVNKFEYVMRRHGVAYTQRLTWRHEGEEQTV